MDASTPPQAQANLAEFPSGGELQILRLALVAFCGAVLFVIAALSIWGFAELLSMFKALLLPISLAGVMALVLHPLIEFLCHRLHLPRVLIVATTVAAVLAATVYGAWLFVPMLAEQISGLYQEGSALMRTLHARFVERFPDAGDYLQQQFEDAEFTSLVPSLEGFVTRLGSWISLLVGFAFVPLFLFFLLLSGSRIKEQLAEQTAVFGLDVQEEIQYLVGVFVQYVAAFFQGQLLIAMLMALLYTAGFTLIGLDAALALGVLSGLLNIVPFLGTVVGLLLVVPHAWMQDGGGPTLTLAALAVFVLVQLVESWLLTPRIMSDHSGLHPAMVIVSLFFWGTVLGGIIGVILAVPLSAFVATLWHQVRYRYARKVVGDFDVRAPEKTTVVTPDPDPKNHSPDAIAPAGT
jgi:predicted PurR-regulated permease PerM